MNHLHQQLPHQPFILLAHMGSEQPQSHSPLDSTTTTTTTTTNAVTTTQQPSKSEATPPPPPPPPPPQVSTSSKIPFRPRKMRKLSSDDNNNNSSVDSTTKTPLQDDDKTKSKTKTKTKITKINVQQIRALPRVVARTLSCEGEIAAAIHHLRSSDPLLARVIDLHQPPTFDSFHPPFLALTKSILYQQLAFKAGTSIYTRFVSLCGGESGVVPEAVLALNPQQLRQIGVSARKASYLHDLANKYRNGILSDSSIVDMDDKSLFTMLTMVKGIGSWSVHMFMIFSLHRPDVLPIGDLGVRKGVQLLYGLEELPRPSQMDQLCEKWRPYRSVAAWYMWRFAEAKAPPSTTVAVMTGTSQQQQQHQQQQQQQQQPQQQQALQLIDPISGIANLG